MLHSALQTRKQLHAPCAQCVSVCS